MHRVIDDLHAYPAGIAAGNATPTQPGYKGTVLSSYKTSRSNKDKYSAGLTAETKDE
jgi:hypothetical protein